MPPASRPSKATLCQGEPLEGGDQRNHVRREVRPDGRIRLWGRVGERWLRVVALPDGETLHNAFFDRSFRP